MSAILDALKLLRVTYPTERVQLWAESSPGREVSYTASVGASGSSETPVFAWGEMPYEAVEKLIAKAGDRDPAKMKEKRIADLKAELAKLETPPQPTVVPEPAETAAA